MRTHSAFPLSCFCLLASAGLTQAQESASQAPSTPDPVLVDAQVQAQDYESRIASLEELTSDLRAQLESGRIATREEYKRIEELVGSVTGAGQIGAPVTGFRIGDTTLRIGGYIDFDLHTTSFADGSVASGSVARDFYIPGATPVGGSSTTATDMTAQSTRFSTTATREFNGEIATAYLETDFLLSAQGDERVSSSFAQRLRRAYVDYAGWRIGQEWSTFQDLSAIPESASFLTLSDGMVFNRQALVRYTNGPWQFAAENGDTTITDVDGTRIEADSNLMPDLVARYNLAGDFGKVSFGAIARQLRSESNALDEETFGWGSAVQGRLNVGERDDIRFTLAAGEGLGRYIGLNAANAVAIDPVGGDLETIDSFGGLLAWRHPFGETARVNFGYAGLFMDNPDFIDGSANRSVQSLYAALLWDIYPKVTVGLELLHAIRELESGNRGELTRGTFSIQYGF